MLVVSLILRGSYHCSILNFIVELYSSSCDAETRMSYLKFPKASRVIRLQVFRDKSSIAVIFIQVSELQL